MAAHLLTVVSNDFPRTGDTQDVVERKCAQLRHGMSFSQWGDQFVGDDWVIMRALFLASDARAIILFWYHSDTRKALEAEYETLGHPETVDEWLKRKYSL